MENTVATKAEAKAAKKEKVQQVQANLILALKQVTVELGHSTKKLDKEIGKSAKHLAKEMLKEVKVKQLFAEEKAAEVAPKIKAEKKPIAKATPAA